MMAISRRRLLALGSAVAATAAAPRRARAERGRFRVFVVQWRGATEVDRGLKDYLARAGLDVTYVERNARQDHAALAAIVAEIKRERPDLVYVFATEAALGVAGPVDGDPADYVTDIPVVFAAVGDPLSARLVHGLRSSGRNVTGVMHLAPVPVQFEAMLSLFEPKRVAVLYNAAETYGRGAVEQLRAVAAPAGVELAVDTPLADDGKPRAELIGPALARLAAGRPDVLYLPSTSFFIPLAKPLTEQAVALGLPAFSANEPMIRTGDAMAGLVASFHEVGQFAGYKIEQILRGGKRPDQVPVEPLSRFSLLINMRVSRQLRVYPPITMLRYAEIIDAR